MLEKKNTCEKKKLTLFSTANFVNAALTGGIISSEGFPSLSVVD